eukprot:675294_1
MVGNHTGGGCYGALFCCHMCWILLLALNIKLNHTGDAMGGAVARAPMLHTGVHSEEGLGLEMTKPETEEPMPPKVALTNTNVSTVLHHPERAQSIEIDPSDDDIELPTTDIPVTNTQETHGTAYEDYTIANVNDDVPVTNT